MFCWLEVWPTNSVIGGREKGKDVDFVFLILRLREWNTYYMSHDKAIRNFVLLFHNLRANKSTREQWLQKWLFPAVAWSKISFSQHLLCVLEPGYWEIAFLSLWIVHYRLPIYSKKWMMYQSVIYVCADHPKSMWNGKTLYSLQETSY